MTRRAYVKANEDTVRRTVRVIVEAIHYAKGNREAALKIMQKYLRVQDREALEDAYESFVVKQFPRVPYATPAAVEIILEQAAHSDPRANTAHTKCLVDMRFVREIEQSGAVDKLYAQTR